MPKIKVVCVLLLSMLCCLSKTNARTITFYCPLSSAISFTPQNDPSGPYLYTSPSAILVEQKGLTPSLTGYGAASQSIALYSANWTDQALCCNYNGLTDTLSAEVMVMCSRPLGYSPSCHFLHGSQCSSSDPYDCPLSCDRL